MKPLFLVISYGVLEMARSVFGITRVINLYSSKYHADRDCMVKSLFWRCAQVGHKRLDLKSCVSFGTRGFESHCLRFLKIILTHYRFNYGKTKTI